MSLRRLFMLLLPLLAVPGACSHGDDGTLLIHDASLVNPETGTVARNRCVWVRDERIDRIAACEPGATAATVIDGRGRWVIPGLWDMHVHAAWDTTATPDMFADFIAWGVVGIRDMGGTPEALAAAREYLAANRHAGPELIAAGQVIDGAPPLQAMIAMSAADAQEGAQAVARLDALGADFIKIYTLLPRDAALGVFDEARRRGLTVAGHLPPALGLTEALRLGMASIEHMAVETGGLCDVTDAAACMRVFDQINDAGTHLVPTLVVRQRHAAPLDPGALERARIGAMPAALAADWQASLARRRQERPAPHDRDRALQFERERRLTTIAIEAGAAILVGTDTGDFLVPPGSSLHEELELLVAAGMSEQAALFAATRRAADFLGLDDRGRIATGAIADLVVLDGNPLDDIRNTRRIAAVILRGELITQ